LIEPNSTTGDKIKALPKIAFFYAGWYPTRWLKTIFTPRYSKYGKWAKHLRFIHRSAAKLARESFHGMALYRDKLGLKKQVFLFRLVDIVNELFAMSATIARAIALEQRGAPEAEQAAELAEAFCRKSRRAVKERFGQIWSNEDDEKVALSRSVMAGKHTWLEAMPNHLVKEDEK
jgi:hypothetical protein